MIRSELYKLVLPNLVEYLFKNGVVLPQEKDDIDDLLALDHYSEVCVALEQNPSAVKYKKFIKFIGDGLSEYSEIMNVLPMRHHTADPNNISRLRAFCFRNSTLAVLPVKTIIDDVADTNSVEINPKYSGIVDLIWLDCLGRMVEMDYFWQCCSGHNKDDYFLLTNEQDDATMNWRLYSYAYFCFVNDSHFERPACLNFIGDTKFCPQIQFERGNEYEQYFEAYNIMSESKYSEDILFRYLRMYQILEYFGYRRILADMTKGNIRENGFVRNLITRASARTQNESTEIKKGVDDLLPPLAGNSARPGVFLSTDITTDMERFIKDKLLLPNYSFDSNQLWAVIYKLRNCIVHNKESDLHFSFSNTDVYADGILLMKLIVEKMEPQIVNVINDPGITGLEFSGPTVRVY